MVPETLVAQDIALTIADFDPAAAVIFAKSAAEAETALGSVAHLAVAFVSDRPSTFVPSALASAIADRGGRVVMLGIEAESTGPTPQFDVLTQPFDIDAVRGLAGIDGNISTALGVASQRSATVAIMGDLSFLHDLTGLIGVGDINLRIFVINNDGGGIFSTLPQHNAVGFEKIFGTPHGLDPALIAESMGVRAETISSIDELQIEMLEPIIGLSVVVLPVPSRRENADFLLELYQSIEAM